MNLNSKTRTKFFFSILTLFFITNNLVAQYSFIDKLVKSKNDSFVTINSI